MCLFVSHILPIRPVFRELDRRERNMHIVMNISDNLRPGEGLFKFAIAPGDAHKSNYAVTMALIALYPEVGSLLVFIHLVSSAYYPALRR